MPVTVKYFAALRELVGETEQHIQLAASACKAAELWRQLNPGISLPDNTLVAINQNYASLEDTLRDGDELAFFPPVTGG